MWPRRFAPKFGGSVARPSGLHARGRGIFWLVYFDNFFEKLLTLKDFAAPSRAYSELSALVGGQVPDLRGLFLRGHGGNSAALGVQQGDAIRNIQGSFGSYLAWYISPDRSPSPFYWSSDMNDSAGSTGSSRFRTSYFDASRVVPTAEENRPVNQAVRYLIRARP